MNINELEILDETLDYLNEGRIIKKIKDVFDNYKKKSRKLDNKDKISNNTNKNKYEAIDPVISKSREKFLKEMLSKAKTISSKYNSQGGIGTMTDISYYEEFYTCACKVNGKLYYNDRYIELIAGSWDELKCYNKPEYKNLTKSEYGDTPEVKKWYDDQEKCFRECKSMFSKYGTIDVDGSYDCFMIDLHLNKETIDSFND